METEKQNLETSTKPIDELLEFAEKLEFLSLLRNTISNHLQMFADAPFVLPKIDAYHHSLYRNNIF